MSKSQLPRYANVLAFMCRHVVALGWYEGRVNDKGEFTAKPEFQGASGFLLMIGGVWCLATAGHVFAGHERRARNGVVAKFVSIIDGWGQSAPTVIPFDFFDAPTWSVYDDVMGLDFAVVALPLNTALLLAKTTVPFSRENWTYQSKMKFDFFAMVGFPNEFAVQHLDTASKRRNIQVDQNPTMIFVRRLHRRPKGIEKTKHTRFVGQLDERTKGQITELVGMSGGPIFGFSKTDGGRLKYWPVAIQSGFSKVSRIITACPLTTVGKMIDKLFLQ